MTCVKMQTIPNCATVLFYEYFDGDTGRGCDIRIDRWTAWSQKNLLRPRYVADQDIAAAGLGHAIERRIRRPSR